ncbi:MAG: hypothetical protein ABIF01_05070 [Candidatus Micrarchaeota archaeon]
MAKSVEQVTEDTVREGGVLSLLYFDIHGKDKESIKNTMVDFIRQLTVEPGVVYAVGQVKDSIEDEEGFATSAEVKLLTKDYPALLSVGMRYGPIGAEIIQPHEIKMTLGEAQSAVLSVSQTSHEFSTYVVQKLMKEEEKVALARKLDKRAELGKKLLGGNDSVDSTPAD